ncbi:MAG: hypothetical protein HKN73_05140 [Gemmatimonadetes bacterium]|nr:hypothetical protein [Gemmatimonadota bacterium]
MNRPTRGLVAALAVSICLFLPSAAESRVVRVEIESRSLVLDGRAFGNAGPYERLTGRLYFAFDPANSHNAQIVDLSLAPTNAEGLVEAWAEFMVLQPVEPGGRRNVAWIEVPNRGGKASLRYFQAAAATVDPVRAEHFGDGLLMRQGLTLIWVGWQPDVPDREGLLRLVIPAVRDASGADIEGLVRADWTLDEAAETLGLGHRGHRPYPVADPEDPDNVLTVRDGRDEPREVIPRESWRFLTSVPGTDPDRIGLQEGFEPGRIYELVYRAKDPWVMGLGLAALRDVASYVKYDLESEFPARQAVGFGVSQTGRFLRHFLYQGFNVDEAGLQAFDGMLIHTAGAGRGSFNHRFAQPSRDAHRYSAFFYPTDLFPFSSRPQEDPVSGRTGGLLEETPEEHRPLTFFTNTGYEYWGRAASLIHTTVDGTEDMEPLASERIYHLAGGQHSVGGFPPDSAMRIPGSQGFVGNPLDFFVALRALALRLVAWVADDEDPPSSRYPRLAEGTLVPVPGLAFPDLPGLDRPRVAHVAYRADYGRRFETLGIVERQPPDLGPAFPALVPQVDGLGNELGGVRLLELRVPVATYAPWSLRLGMPGGVDELRDFTGTWIPFAPSDGVAGALGDPRPSVAAAYGSKDDYMKRARAAARDLVLEGFLLSEDVPRALARAEELWDWVAASAPEPPAN